MDLPRFLRTVRGVGLVLTALLLAFLLVTVALLALAPKSLETPAEIADVEALEAFFERLVATQNPPSVAVAVVENDEVVYQRSFGLADGPGGIEATPQTAYRWWSLTKILTALAILQLHERKQLDIEDEVRTYLPFFETTLRGKQSPPIRLWQLLDHSSGLPNSRLDVLPGGQTGHPGESRTLELIEENFDRFSHLQATPGQRGRYSNFGYLVLGAVVEKVSGQSYEEYVSENILRPLGMRLTGFTVTDDMRPHVASGCHPLIDFQTIFLPAIPDIDTYVREIDEGRIWLAPFPLQANPYGGALGPVTDAARLLRAILNEGSVDGRAVLQPETVHLMLTGHRVPAAPSTVAPAYYRRAGMEHGMGFWVFPRSGGERYEHTGAGLGFASIFRLYPEEGLAIALLANGTSLDREGIADRLYELFHE